MFFWDEYSTCIVAEPVVAEEIVTLHAVELSYDFGLHNIILEGDSMQRVNAVNTIGQNWSRYKQIVENIKGILNILKNWQISRTKRETNYGAYGLPKTTIKQVMNSIWLEEILFFFFSFFNLRYCNHGAVCAIFLE